MTTADKVLSILQLFSIEQPEWTVEAVSAELNISASSAYQYVRSLVTAGLLVANNSGRYIVGPAVIELDRLMRRYDPLIHEAQEPLRQIVAPYDGNAIGLLCRIYRLRVMCVDQYVLRAPSFAISYERGRPMPLARGAASKSILAHLNPRQLRNFYDSNPTEVSEAGLGDTWQDFKAAVRSLRKSNVVATAGELDAGLMGISAPVFDASNNVLGSIGLVVSDHLFNGDEPFFNATKQAVLAAGRDITIALQSR
ncbi:IclR family transcriptional regulator [Novosphingobium sp. Leaf2]|uniref:IclR family transcriptional regulator n=1 Tax=Novosphingobium sp. Leaf2 TaxID=1735670 RepID=UPI0006FC9D00|nr:IclR family transcriptional regulator C-terminal domain-containing protein [Novosphingobium sp. Leaf2]KQM20888.1 IclR family transcriptional regulator [Novosphingobium sp. Leaf2]